MEELERPSSGVTAVVALGTVFLAFIALGAGRNWTTGVIGGGDAWQNLWNVQHVEAALYERLPLLTTSEVWAPEGASLATHTLALPLSVPAAILAPAVGLPLSYNLAVLLTFAITGAGLFRLARRLCVSNSGATLAALAFAFAPPRFCRAYGHLNLLGLGMLGFAIEGLILTGAPRGRNRLFGVLEATLALSALLYTDFYLALLGGLAAGAYGAFALVRERTNRAGRMSLMVLVAAGVLVVAGPLLVRVGADRTAVETGHPSKWCSVALTSLAIPARVQALSVLTRTLTERNHQNLVEGVGYLGWLPVFAAAWVIRKGRPRAFDFALVSGGIALVLALGPQLRIFDRLLDVPLPYALFERVVPGLRLGGCVNRLEQLVFLPLALYLGVWSDRMRTRPILRALGVFVLFFEYLPWRVPVEQWPLNPPDAALAAIATDRSREAVLDTDMGAAALVRQLTHRHPLSFGYLSRIPVGPAQRRKDDPILSVLLDPDATRALGADALAAYLDYRFRIHFVLAPNNDLWREHLIRYGLTTFASSPQRTLVMRTVARPAASLFAALTPDQVSPPLPGGVITFGFAPANDEYLAGRTQHGSWAGVEADFVMPVSPGVYRLTLHAPSGALQPITIEWGRHHRTTQAVLFEKHEYTLDVLEDDLIARTWLGVTIHTESAQGERPEGGPLFLGFEKR
jgi:hypothetical protein